jgi:hypothetical protein
MRARIAGRLSARWFGPIWAAAIRIVRGISGWLSRLGAFERIRTTKDEKEGKGTQALAPQAFYCGKA